MGTWGNNKFFSQEKEVLVERRVQLEYLLRKIWGRNDYVVALYLEAFDYFCVNKNEFDGASIVADLCSLPELDLPAMLHDYLYIVFNVAYNYLLKYYADKIYALEIQRLGFSGWSASTRFYGLTIILGITFTPYRYLCGLRADAKQKEKIKEIYNNFK